MVGQGRESQKDNDLVYTCGWIEYIARKRRTIRSAVVRLGKDRISKIYEFADVYHCENIDAVSDDFIEDASIVPGTFDNVADCGYAVPSHWDIGKVYKRLIKMVAAYEKIGRVVTAKLFGIKSAGKFVRKYDTIN